MVFCMTIHTPILSKEALKAVIFFVISLKKMWQYLLAVVFQASYLMANHPGTQKPSPNGVSSNDLKKVN